MANITIFETETFINGQFGLAAGDFGLPGNLGDDLTISWVMENSATFSTANIFGVNGLSAGIKNLTFSAGGEEFLFPDATLHTLAEFGSNFTAILPDLTDPSSFFSWSDDDIPLGVNFSETPLSLLKLFTFGNDLDFTSCAFTAANGNSSTCGTIEDTDFSATAVPLPAGMILLLSGVAAFDVMRRRRQKRRADI